MINQTHDVKWLCHIYYPKELKMYDVVSEHIVTVPVNKNEASAREDDTKQEDVLPEAQAQDDIKDANDSDVGGNRDDNEWIQPRYTTRSG